MAGTNDAFAGKIVNAAVCNAVMVGPSMNEMEKGGGGWHLRKQSRDRGRPLSRSRLLPDALPQGPQRSSAWCCPAPRPSHPAMTACMQVIVF